MVVTIFLCAVPASAVALDSAPWSDSVVARINGEAILYSDAKAYAIVRPTPTPPAPAADAANRADAPQGALPDDWVDPIIDHRLLLAEAQRFGVAAPTRAEVDAATPFLAPRRTDITDPVTLAALPSLVREYLWVEAFLDARVRAFVMVRAEEVDAALATSGGSQPGETGAAARARARAQLVDVEATTRLASLLERIRARAKIVRYSPRRVRAPTPQPTSVESPRP